MLLFGHGRQHGDVRVAAQAEHVAHAAPLQVTHQVIGDCVLHVIVTAKRLGVVELAKQLLVGGAVLGNRAADPGGLHEMLEVNVLVGDVAAPDAAAQAGGHRHAIGERARIGFGLRLANHHAADRRHSRERSMWSSSCE